MSTRLPDALTNSEYYSDLTDKQAFNLRARIDYVEEIAGEIMEWLDGHSDSENLEEFLDLLEVDVAVNQNLDTGDDYLSSWLIHSSWGDGVKERPRREKLPCDLITDLDSQLPALGATGEEFNSWLRDQRDALGRALNSLSTAGDFSSVLSSLLCLDILMAKLLVGLYKHRFR